MPTPLFKNLSLERLSEVFGYIKAELDKKVTVVSGKGLSTNDYTTTEKNKLSGIASGAEANVQSNWSETNTSSDAYILNKPTKLSDFTNDVGYTTNIGTVTQVKVGSTAYNPSSGVVSLPAYPTVPTKTSQLTNDSGFLTSHQDISGKVNKSGDTMTGTLKIDPNIVQIDFRDQMDYHTTVSYQTNGNEALVFATKYLATSFIFINGEDSITNHASSRWQSLTPALQIKNNKIAINKLIANNMDLTYALEVNGDVSATNFRGSIANATGLTKAQVTTALGYTPSTSSHTHSNIVTAGDNRDVATTPNDYANKIIFQGLKTNSKIGSPSTVTYSYLIGLRGWSDSSGGNSWELAFNNTGINVRNGATTSWGNWQTLITSGNIGSQSVNYATSAGSATSATSATKATKDGSGNTITSTYLKKTGDSMSSTITFNGSDSYGLRTTKDNYSTIGEDAKRFGAGYIAQIYTWFVRLKGANSSEGGGYIDFYNNYNGNYVKLQSATSLSDSRTVYLPNASGTIALTSDIPSQTETARRSRYTMSTKGAWTAVSYSSNLPSSYGHAIILIYYTTSSIRCLINEIRVTKAEWEGCANPNIMMPFVSSPPNDAYGVYLQYVSTSQFKYYVGTGLAGDWSVTIKTTVV